MKRLITEIFTDQEMVFYKNVSDLSEKIIKISNDEKLRKIGKKGKHKYLKYFNSTEVAKNITLKPSSKKIKRIIFIGKKIK